MCFRLEFFPGTNHPSGTSSGIVVEDPGEEGCHIQRGRTRSAGDFGQLLFRVTLPSHESADTFPT